MEQIGESVFHLPDVLGGPTLLADDEAVTLFDTGIPGSETAIFDALESLGRERVALAHVLITHADPDHVGGLAAVVEATGAQVYAGEYEADVIEGKTPNRRGDVRVWGRVDRRLAPGETIDLHGGVEAIATHGHTLGHLAYLLPREGLLLAGDCVNNRDGLAASPPEMTADAEQAREAVRTIAALRPRNACFGHGPSLVGDAADRLEALAASL